MMLFSAAHSPAREGGNCFVVPIAACDPAGVTPVTTSLVGQVVSPSDSSFDGLALLSVELEVGALHAEFLPGSRYK